MPTTIRGIVGDTLTPEIVRRIGGAIGAEAHHRGVQTVVVGRDGRHSSAELLAALVEGLRESGRDVVDVGRVPTPVLYFAAEHLETGSGVMVTGSHNPSDYNGLKIVLAGETLHSDAIQDLRRRIEENDLDSGADVRGQGDLRSTEIVADYIRRVCDGIPAARGREARRIVIGLRQRWWRETSHPGCSGRSGTTWSSSTAMSTVIFPITIRIQACRRICAI